MTYLIIGNKSTIEKQISTILKKIEVNPNSIIKYDLEETSILKVIEELDTFNLFESQKLVICNNINKIDDDKALIKYLENQDKNILILTATTPLDERKKITKEIKKNSTVIDTLNEDLSEYIKSSLKDYKTDIITINLIKEYCNNDYTWINNELDKLKMYKLEEKEITTEDVELLIKKNLDSNIFDLMDAINQRNKTKLFNVYYELINNNEDEIKIISIIANNFRLLLKIKILLEDTKEEEIIKILSLHPYRFKKLKEQNYIYSKTDLYEILKNLSELDINIKSGNIDKKIGTELFLSRL